MQKILFIGASGMLGKPVALELMRAGFIVTLLARDVEKMRKLYPNTSIVKDATHKYTATGNYNVKLVVTSNKGCKDSITQVFTINGAVPVSTFTVQNGLQHCSNDSVKITDNSTVNPGKLVKLEIFWDYANDPTNKSVINNPTPGSIYSHKYAEFFTPAAKNYIV